MAKSQPSLFDDTDEDAEGQALKRAEADYAAGRVVSNAAMLRWFASWGTPKPLPRPKCGE